MSKRDPADTLRILERIQQDGYFHSTPKNVRPLGREYLHAAQRPVVEIRHVTESRRAIAFDLQHLPASVVERWNACRAERVPPLLASCGVHSGEMKPSPTLTWIQGVPRLQAEKLARALLALFDEVMSQPSQPSQPAAIVQKGE